MGGTAGIMQGLLQSLDEVITQTLERVTGGGPAFAALRQAWIAARQQSNDEKKCVRTFVTGLFQDGFCQVARHLMDELVAQFPIQAWLWMLAADLAENAGDYDAMLAYARSLDDQFPDLQAATRMMLDALVALGRLDDAALVLDTLSTVQLQEDWALTARIALAERSRDDRAAFAAGTALALRKPKRPDGTVAAIAAARRMGRLDEAEQRLRQALNHFPQHPAVLQAAAELAEARGEHEAALTRWTELRKRARATTAPFLGTLRCLKMTKRMDLAMPVVCEGLARFPQDEELLVAAARMAEGSNQADDADLFWQRAVAVCPDNAGYALSAALCLMCLPATRAARMPEVLRRLEAHHLAFPDYAEAYAAHINALRSVKKPGLAIALSELWRSQFPTNVAIALARVGAFDDQGLFDSALEEVMALRGQVPRGADIEIAYARALSAAGRHDEADEACAAALRRNPSHLRLLIEYARTSTRRGDWQQGYDRLLAAQKLLPGHDRIAQELRNMQMQMAELAPAEQAPPVGGRTLGAGGAIARFESLGGTGVSCEFGMVQRQLGSDTVGLLRWSRNDIGHLLDALAHEFEGVGSEDNTILKSARHAADHEEYVTQDRRYFMESHTFVRTSDAPRDAMFKQTCRRLRFLRGKLLEDLRAAEKMFVFKAHRAVSDDELRALHAALRRYGDNALIGVMRADAANPRATVRQIARGLYAGYVGHFVNDGSGLAGSDVTGWDAILAQADTLWRGAAASDTPAPVAASA
jgi:tetratricopeptide (TPR) repeat protein